MKKKLKIMVIELGIYQNSNFGKTQPFYPVKPYTDNEWNWHGTFVFGIVLFGDLYYLHNEKYENISQSLPHLCKEVEVEFCQSSPSPGNIDYGPKQCLRKAIKENFNVINFSSENSNLVEVFELWQQFSAQGGVSYISAGNDGKFITKRNTPQAWALKDSNGNKIITNMYIVQNLNPDGTLNESSNFHPEAISEIGTAIYNFGEGKKMNYGIGTSFSAPLVVHKVAEQFCRQISKNKSLRKKQ